MPFYDVQHTHPLSAKQKDDIAEAITSLHTELFSAPKLFVNVAFTDVSNRQLYLGGRQEQQINHILAHVRAGGGRSKESLDHLAAGVDAIWNRFVGSTTPDSTKRCITFVLSDIAAGVEKGFNIPAAGEDKAWIKEHLGTFKRLAADGDETFRQLLKEIETRSTFKDLLT